MLKKMLVLIFLLNVPAFAFNVAYNHVTGDIYELDNGDVSRFVGQVDTTTGTVIDSNVETTLPVTKLTFKNGRVSSKSDSEIKAIDNRKLSVEIIHMLKEISALNNIASNTQDKDILTEIQKSTTALTQDIINKTASK